MGNSQLTLSLFGTPHVEINGKRCRIATRKATALLVYLAVTTQSHSRETIATLFWPESDTARAKASLRRALADIKKALGGDWVASDRNTIWLNQKHMQVDVWQYRQLLAQNGGEKDVEKLTAASTLYRDDFLNGFSVLNCYTFDEWQFFEAENLRQSFAQLLDDLIVHHKEAGSYAEAIPYGRRRVALDTLHEPAHLQLMELYARAGQQAAALRQFHECERILEAELGIQPQPELIELHKKIAAHELSPSIAPSQKPPAPTPAPPSKTTLDDELTQPVLPQHNLPIDQTSFVGRKNELKQVASLLTEEQVRLLTVVGLGGMGKTRLMVEAARTQIEQFADGSWLVDLTTIQSGQQLVSTIAKPLGLIFHGAETPKAQLLSYLAEKHLLLLMDNFEHLLDEAPLLGDLLNHAPRLKIMVTSRERLDLAQEWLFPLEGLSYPAELIMESAPQQVLSNQFLLKRPYTSYSAVQLFSQRARQAKHDFTFTTQETHVLRICTLTEGMPLALELAAAWVRMLSCAQIVTEIERSLQFLASTQRNVAERHRTVWAVFESSWQMLNDAEQQLLARLSIFRGSFTWEAVAEITEAPIYTFFSLLNKSLVRKQPAERFEMHELLRQFAAAKLAVTELVTTDSVVATEPEPAQIAARHTAYYTNWLHEREPELFDAQQPAALNVIGQELDNLYQAWFWAIEQGDVAAIRKSVHSLYNFHTMRSLLEQGNQLFQQAINLLEQNLTISTAEENALITLLMTRQGEFLYLMGRVSDAKQILQETLKRSRKLSLSVEMEISYRMLGTIAYLQGEYQKAQDLLRKALNLTNESNEPHKQAYTLMTAGAVAIALGNYKEAEQLQWQSLAMYEALDYKFGIVNTMRFLGTIAFRQKAYNEALSFHQQSLDLSRSFHYEFGEALALNGLGLLAQANNEFKVARELFQKGLQLGQDNQTKMITAVSLQNLGKLVSLLESPAQGISYLQKGLAVASEVNATPLMLEIMVDMVLVLPTPQLGDMALKMLTVAQRHPASNWETQKKAEKALVQLAAPIQRELLQAAYIKEATLEELISEMLAQK